MKTLILALALANPSFEVNAPTGTWNKGPVPAWTCTGVYGLWQPAKSYFATLPDGATVLWINQGSCSQDLRITPAPSTDYVIKFSVGRRADMPGVNFHVALSDPRGDPDGTFCVMSGNTGFIPAGTFHEFTFRCPVDGSGAGATEQQGNLWLTLASEGSQTDFDSVSITSESPN